MIDLDFYSSKATEIQYTDEELEESRERFKNQVDAVKLAMSGIGASKYELGRKLIELYDGKDYASDPGWIMPCKTFEGKRYGYYSGYTFVRICEKHFDLDKSQVSRYMNVVDEFGDGDNGLKPKWAAYSWSQLVELLPLTPEERAKVNPEMTISAIRAYKQTLVATSQQEEKGKDKKSVATSQQSSRIIKSSDLGDKGDESKYWRFVGYSTIQLCDKFLDLENENKALKNKIRNLEALSAPQNGEGDNYGQTV